MKHLLSILVGFLPLLTVTHSYNILFFHDSGTRSHLNLYFPLIEEMLDRGHNVTSSIYTSANIKHKNYTELVTRDVAKEFFKEFSKTLMEDSSSSKYGMLNPKLLMTIFQLIPEFFEKMIEIFKSPEFQKILEGQYDVIVSTSMQVGFIAELLDAPVIYISPPGPMHIITERIGNRFYPGLYPNLGISFNDPKSFSQRLLNLATTHGMNLYFYTVSRWMESTIRRELDYNGPGLIEAVSDRCQIVLSNSHPITHDPQPFLENIVHIGGLHIREPKPLPADLKKFLDSHPEGVVYVSFGSSINPSSMQEDKRQAFINTFKRLKMPIIWKWDAEATNDIPKNVLVKNWLPQQDLLAHPNLKVFVTHGGLLSVMEAIHSSTVMVGIPLANDQRPNLMRIVDKQLGLMLDLDQLDEQVFTEAIQKALTSKEMQENMAKVSRLFKDQKEPPVKKAAWWIEYTIRNNGTDFLRPLSMDLVWYKAWNLDILLVMLVITFTVLYINIKILKTCLRCCCGRKKTKVE